MNVESSSENEDSSLQINGFESLDVEIMKHTLTTIALEIQRFHADSISSSPRRNDNDEIFDKLEVLQTSLKRKNNIIRKLKTNIKTVINIAKAVLIAKQNETASLNKQLLTVRSEATALSVHSFERAERCQKLTIENQTLKSKIESLQNIIELSYKELLNIRNEPNKAEPVAMQLKKIVFCCGQYYADYCNERENRQQLEHKSRFLKNKLNILENNLASSEAEVNSLKHKITRLVRNKLPSKDYVKRIARDHNTVKITCSERQVNNHYPDKNPNYFMCRKTSSDALGLDQLDLSSHITLTRNLIDDQGSMLKELRDFCEELC